MDLLFVANLLGLIVCGLLWLLDKLLPVPRQDGEWMGKRVRR